ncbi:hypothetical protein D3C76_1817890 [compost metagenome]
MLKVTEPSCPTTGLAIVPFSTVRLLVTDRPSKNALTIIFVPKGIEEGTVTNPPVTVTPASDEAESNDQSA